MRMYQPITGASRTGDFVLVKQDLATKNGFRNVSATWYDQTLSFDEGLSRMSTAQKAIEDAYVHLGEIVPTVFRGRFCVETGGRHLFPTEHALKQLASILQVRKEEST